MDVYPPNHVCPAGFPKDLFLHPFCFLYICSLWAYCLENTEYYSIVMQTTLKYMCP